MVGVLLGVAQGQLSHRGIYEMLTIPSKHSCNQVSPAPAHGLYLASVDYNADDLEKMTAHVSVE